MYHITSVVSFAYEDIIIPRNGLKYLLRVEDWPFAALTNRLVISMGTHAEDGCIRYTPSPVVTNDVASDNLRSLAVKINGVTLYLYFIFSFGH